MPSISGGGQLNRRRITLYRGTTPTLRFDLPIPVKDITALSIAVSQDGKLLMDKGADDVDMDGNTIKLTLTEKETLSLRASTNNMLHIQLRCGVGSARMASQIFSLTVEDILRDGELA